MESVAPAGYLPQLRRATANLIAVIDGLPDEDVRAPSPLPGWTRGHVLTHLEVLIHHVDLDIGYRPRDWPAAFAGDYLGRAVSALRGRAGWPGAVRIP